MFSDNKYRKWLLTAASMMVSSILVSLIAVKVVFEGFGLVDILIFSLIAFVTTLIVWAPFKTGLVNIVVEAVFLISMWQIMTWGRTSLAYTTDLSHLT